MISVIKQETLLKYDSNYIDLNYLCFIYFRKTLKQSSNQTWYEARKVRITASRGYKIWRALTARSRWTHLRPKLTGSAITNVEYGTAMEPVARKKFTEVTGYTVLECGLVVKEGQSWLASSPDGLFRDSNNELCCLEIKCPVSAKGKDIDVKYIKDNELVKKHEYYSQVMIQLYTCNLKKCAFFVYSERDYKLLWLKFDQDHI